MLKRSKLLITFDTVHLMRRVFTLVCLSNSPTISYDIPPPIRLCKPDPPENSHLNVQKLPKTRLFLMTIFRHSNVNFLEGHVVWWVNKYKPDVGGEEFGCVGENCAKTSTSSSHTHHSSHHDDHVRAGGRWGIENMSRHQYTGSSISDVI